MEHGEGKAAFCLRADQRLTTRGQIEALARYCVGRTGPSNKRAHDLEERMEGREGTSCSDRSIREQETRRSRKKLAPWIAIIDSELWNQPLDWTNVERTAYWGLKYRP